jgi:chloramphenicol O-acetyltransferase type A
VVRPSIAVLGGDEISGVVALAYDPDLTAFAPGAADRMAEAKEEPSMVHFGHDQDGDFARDDLLSMTLIPWLSFTRFSLTRKPQVDAVPLLAWGKVLEDGDRTLLPFSVNFHHALVDGLHIARFVAFIEEEARQLAESFG